MRHPIAGIAMIRIAIVDDHALVRAGLRLFLSEHVDMRVEAECASAREVMDVVRREEADVILLDIAMPGQSGVDALHAIQARAPDLPVLILSSFPEEHYASTLLRQGACGYLPKDCEPQEIVDAIRTVALGRRYVSHTLAERLAAGLNEPLQTPGHEQLSDREFQVFLRLAQGETTGQMAQSLSLSVKTVSTYRSRVMEKMGLQTNSDLTYYAVKNGLLQ
jgi:two-component system, NarL family, invasion response regulator UvrY